MPRLLQYGIWFFALLISLNSGAQKCPEMKNSEGWADASAYAKDRENVKECLRWLCKSAYGADIKCRSEVNVYVLQWLAGTPEITVELKSEYIPQTEVYQEEIMYSMLHGMAYYLLDHKDEKDELKLHMKGLEVVAKLAEQSEELSKDKNIKALLRAYRKGKLMEYAKQQPNKAADSKA
jgi:hypothetical protein